MLKKKNKLDCKKLMFRNSKYEMTINLKRKFLKFMSNYLAGVG